MTDVDVENEGREVRGSGRGSGEAEAVRSGARKGNGAGRNRRSGGERGVLSGQIVGTEPGSNRGTPSFG